MHGYGVGDQGAFPDALHGSVYVAPLVDQSTEELSNSAVAGPNSMPRLFSRPSRRNRTG